MIWNVFKIFKNQKQVKQNSYTSVKIKTDYFYIKMEDFIKMTVSILYQIQILFVMNMIYISTYGVVKKYVF